MLKHIYMTNKHYMRLEKTLLIWRSSLACQILPFVVARCYSQHSLSSMLGDTANPLKAACAENPLLPGVSGFTQQSSFSGHSVVGLRNVWERQQLRVGYCCLSTSSSLQDPHLNEQFR